MKKNQIHTTTYIYIKRFRYSSVIIAIIVFASSQLSYIYEETIFSISITLNESCSSKIFFMLSFHINVALVQLSKTVLYCCWLLSLLSLYSVSTHSPTQVFSSFNTTSTQVLFFLEN